MSNSHQQQSHQSQRPVVSNPTPSVEVVPEDETPEETAGAPVGEHQPTMEELRAAYDLLMQGGKREMIFAHAAQQTQQPVMKAKEPDPYEPDEYVTLLMPRTIRGTLEGVETKEGRVYLRKTQRDYVGTEQPGQIDEETGRPGKGLAVTLTFVGGVCKDVPYAIAKGLKKSRAFRSNDTLKVVPNETPENEYAKLCGVQPMLPTKLASMLQASDIDAILAEYTTEQLAVFAAALRRRNEAIQAETARTGVLSSSSFTRG